MAAFVEFKDKKIRKFLLNIQKNTKDIQDKKKKVIGVFSAVVFKDVMDHFDKEQGPSRPWKHWSLFYSIAMERKGKGGNKILQDSGKLRQSFTPKKFKNVKDGVLWFNNAQTKSGFPYAYAHDNDEEPRKTLDRRSFMWLSSKAHAKLAKLILVIALKGKK